MNEQQVKEYQEMKLNFQRFKESSIFHEGLNKKMIRSFLKSVPKNLLIEALKDMKLIKRNWELK